MDFLLWLETLPPSVWLRYSLSLFAFPFIIAIHTIGLAWLAGPNIIIDLRILGVAPGMSLPALGRFFPVMIIGFWINLITGVWLSVAYASTMLMTNPMIYIKLFFIIVAIVILRVQVTRILPNGGSVALPGSAKAWAAASLFCWLMAVTTGRMMAYVGLFFG